MAETVFARFEIVVDGFAQDVGVGRVTRARVISVLFCNGGGVTICLIKKLGVFVLYDKLIFIRVFKELRTGLLYMFINKYII